MAERELAALAAAVGALSERKAGRLVVIDLRGRVPFADFFVICHGTSERQVRSLAEAVQGEVRDRTGLRPRLEGEPGAEWVLLDYGDVLVHVFSEAGREYYRLDRLWGDAPHLDPARVLAGEI